MLASFPKRDLRNLIQRDASPNFQAQNGLLSLRSWWRSVRSLDKSIRFPQLVAAQPLTILSGQEALNASGSMRAWRMATSRKCPSSPCLFCCVGGEQTQESERGHPLSGAKGATHFLAPGKRGWPVSSRHLSSPIRHPALVICHFSFPIPRSEFRIPHFLAEGATHFLAPGKRRGPLSPHDALSCHNYSFIKLRVIIRS